MGGQHGPGPAPRRGAAAAGPAAAPAGPVTQAASPGLRRRVLGGKAVMVSGFAGEDRTAVEAKIKKLGATLLHRVPADAEAALGAAPVALIHRCMDSNTPKLLYAAIAGVPVVQPSWLEACEKQERCADVAPHLQPKQPCRGHRAFDGLRVLAHCEKGAEFAPLLRLAGAEVEEAPAGGGKSGGRVGRKALDCDLVLLGEGGGHAVPAVPAAPAVPVKCSCHSASSSVRPALTLGPLPPPATSPPDDEAADPLAAALAKRAEAKGVPVRKRSWAIDALLRVRPALACFTLEKRISEHGCSQRIIPQLPWS